MPGVRLRHPDLRSCTYTLIHLGRSLTREHHCWVCGEVHYHKTYHLGLDSMGEVVVSEVIYERLKEAGLDELRTVGEERKPEPQRVSVNGEAKVPHIVAREKQKG